MKRRIAISTLLVGGAGGSERAVWSLVRALPEYAFDIYAKHQAGGELQDFGPDTKVRKPLWWRELGPSAPAADVINRSARPLRRRLTPRYDLHLHFQWGPENLRLLIRANFRALDPIGSDAWSVAANYDVAVLKSPADRVRVPPGMRTVILPPPWYPMAAATSELPAGVPERFYFTAMNPYGPVKGVDLMKRTAGWAALPIVWCYSERSVRAMDGHTADLPANVIPIIDPTQGQLRALHEACVAYVSFSDTEGFGWSLADAMMYDAPIISRCTGLFTIPDIDNRGVSFFDTEEQLIGLLAAGRHRQEIERELGGLSPDAFRRRFFELMALDWPLQG